ncbi:hypothetical protein NFI96_024234 [Prochilodus magdalenae]|nr:hypothetical protein NFI96_024234 [Prochilodus magdalenae]
MPARSTSPSRTSKERDGTEVRPDEFKRMPSPNDKSTGVVWFHSGSVDRPGSPSCVSKLSEMSMDIPVHFREMDFLEKTSVASGALTADSGLSVKSGWSCEAPLDLWLLEPRPSPRRAEPGDVVCDLCEGRKSRACKSCLTCLSSFCERHIRDHYTVEALQRHLLVEVTKNLNILQENAQLRKMIKDHQRENQVLKKEIAALKFPKYICMRRTPVTADLILDPGSAHCSLVLSEDGKRVRLGERKPSDSGARIFDKREFVMATGGFTSGRHYWEVEVNREFTIGVTRASAERRGKFNLTPPGGYWCLYHYIQSFTALEEPSRRLPIKAVPRVLGVCVDVEERWVTFYNAETKAPIYTFTQMDFADGERIYPVFSTLEKSAGLEIKNNNDHLFYLRARLTRRLSSLYHQHDER